MEKTVNQHHKEFFVNHYVPTNEEVRVGYARLFSLSGDTKFFNKEDWERLERENKSHYGYQNLQPYCLWAEAHTLSVQDEVITITRDANNNVSHFQYGKDNFNTICVKNLDEARKIENNNALFGGLYVVDYSTKKIYRLTVKQNDRVRLERIMNSYVTGLPWFRSRKFNKVRIWNGVLDTLQYRPSENGY